MDNYGVFADGSVSEQQLKKRARSRKSSERRFYCTYSGCEKSFTRSEHLSRHKYVFAKYIYSTFIDVFFLFKLLTL